jgi:prophage regulatory protein
MDSLLSKKRVVEITGIPYPTIWKMMRRNEFPRSVKVGQGHFGRIAWYASEIEAWIASRPRQTFIGDPGHANTLARRAGQLGARARAQRMKRARRRLEAAE